MNNNPPMIKEKVKNRYVFPNILANAMKNVSMRAQLESAMLSQGLLCIGMILMGLYTVLFTNQTWLFKASILFNIICGFVLMSSYLVTSFQQYQNYMDTLGLDSDKEKEELRKRGNLFKRIKLAMAERKLKRVAAKLQKVNEEEKPEQIKTEDAETIIESERRAISEL